VQQRAGRFGARLQPSRRHDQGPGDSHEPFKVAKARGHDGQTLAGREAQDLFALALPVLVGEPEPLGAEIEQGVVGRSGDPARLLDPGDEDGERP